MKRTFIRSLVVIVVLAGVSVIAGPYIGASLDATKANAAETTQGDQASESSASEDKEKAEAAKILVSVVQATRRDLVDVTTLASNLEAEQEIVVRAEAAGRVVRLAVEEGDRVAKGHTLVGLDAHEARVASRRANVQVEGAQDNMARAERLAKRDLVATEELEKLQRERVLSKQDLAEAQLRLAKLTVRAPFGGRITERLVTLGKYVQPGEELFRLADFDPLLARVHVPFRDVARLSEGQTVQLAYATTIRCALTVPFAR